MAYIDPDWIADEHFEYLDANFDMSKYDLMVDRKIKAIALKELVAVDDIPVDEITGYVTSIPLQVYGIALYKRAAFMGYWGKRNGTNDIYYKKLMEIDKEIDEARQDITNGSITNSSDDSTADDLTKQNTIKLRPMY